MDRTARLLDFLKANPNDSFLQHALALEYIKTGDDAAAKEMFETILTRDPHYTGSYYHLGKLLERSGETQMAIAWYKKGMAVTKALGDNHSYNELKAVYEDLVD